MQIYKKKFFNTGSYCKLDHHENQTTQSVAYASKAQTCEGYHQNQLLTFEQNNKQQTK